MAHRELDTEDVLERIRRARIVPVVRAPDAGTAESLVGRIVDGGLDVIEITTTIPGWESLAGRLRTAHPHVCLGVGTLTSAALAAAAVDAGAEFGVTPFPVAPARAVAERAGIPLLEGGFTPAEVVDAASRGVAKLFPASVGGVSYLGALLGIAPGARIVPTGGIGLGEVAEWLAAGAFAVGVGSDLAHGDVAARVRQALDG
jgi:2-dehydro-3-deoxyphosphogluconate aldolase/(4S)-4-hydroxy-2-oxoglutarate aldolase